MKHTTTSLLKFLKLQRRLKESRRGTVGLLELLWHSTQMNAPQGDIGKFTNEEIAILCDWEGDHDELIAALVDAKWLDESEEHRLLVHDWADHCPNYVKGNLRRHDKSVIGDQQAALSKNEQQPTQPCSAGCSEKATHSTLPPNLTKPNLTKPVDVDVDAAALEEDLTEVLSTAKRYLKSMEPPGSKSNGKPVQKLEDADLLLKVSLLRHRNILAESVIERAFESVRSRSPPPTKPFAYLHDEFKRMVPNFNGLLKENPVPPALFEMAKR